MEEGARVYRESGATDILIHLGSHGIRCRKASPDRCH